MRTPPLQSVCTMAPWTAHSSFVASLHPSVPLLTVHDGEEKETGKLQHLHPALCTAHVITASGIALHEEDFFFNVNLSYLGSQLSMVLFFMLLKVRITSREQGRDGR